MYNGLCSFMHVMHFVVVYMSCALIYRVIVFHNLIVSNVLNNELCSSLDSDMKFVEKLRAKCRAEVARYGPHDIKKMTDTDMLGVLYKKYVVGLGILNLSEEEEHYLVLMELIVWRRLTVLWFA